MPGEQQFSFDFGTLSVAEMKFWLCRFVLEVRKANGEPYNPTTLYQIGCGLLRHLCNNSNRSDVNFMDSSDFHQFRATLDSELKRLNATYRKVH